MPLRFAGWSRSGAALTLLLLLPQSRGRPGPGVLAVSTAYAAVLLLFTLANKLTTAANSILLQSTAPLYLIALGPRLIGERPRQIGEPSAP